MLCSTNLYISRKKKQQQKKQHNCVGYRVVLVGCEHTILHIIRELESGRGSDFGHHPLTNQSMPVIHDEAVRLLGLHGRYVMRDS